MRTLTAAAIQKGDTVRLETTHGESVELTVFRIHNATPIAGRITWENEAGKPYEIGAAVRVAIVKL